MVSKKWIREDGTVMTCYRPECDKPVSKAGLCSTHYSRSRNGLDERPVRSVRWVDEDEQPVICAELNCRKSVHCRGYCRLHYDRLMRNGTTNVTRQATKDAQGKPLKCSEADCESDVYGRGMCQRHYTDWWRSHTERGTKSVSYCSVPGCGRKLVNADAVLCANCRKTRWRYGVSDERFIEYMQPENRKCGNPGCMATDTVLHMDHDHKCCPPGKFETRTRISCGECVRGWLCQPCNTSLGELQEDPRRIEGLLRYLEGERG